MTHWAQTRTTTLHVNGEATAPIPSRAGVGQGDVFSCVLYNIFINSLHNYLKAEGLHITPTPGINLTLLEFVEQLWEGGVGKEAWVGRGGECEGWKFLRV